MEAARRTVEGFFARRRAVSLRLPGGWFGRPGDNAHRLTGLSADDEGLRIELDGTQALVLHGPVVATDHGRVLRLTAFAHATWRWVPYGSAADERPRERRFDGGTIELHG